jgi:hypothetical protein
VPRVVRGDLLPASDPTHDDYRATTCSDCSAVPSLLGKKMSRAGGHVTLTPGMGVLWLVTRSSSIL